MDIYHDANRHEDAIGSDHTSGMDDDQRVREVFTAKCMSMRVDIVHVVHGAESLCLFSCWARGRSGQEVERDAARWR